ncbi:MAG: peptide deformylase [Acidobacteria bacterium]|nr:peptide deformylase [Acidobacteriota bacterium]
MPIRDILILGNPQLWQSSEAVVDVQSHNTQELIRDLSETLASFRANNGFGRAIAAPQIGAQQRVIYTNVRGGIALINPIISEASEEMFELWDDCFSLPNLMVRVKRHVAITVDYTDEHGAPQQLKLQNDLSELLQHEIDHLDGILATDRAIDKRSFAMRSEIGGVDARCREVIKESLASSI